jgi:hypothetical protein
MRTRGELTGIGDRYQLCKGGGRRGGGGTQKAATKFRDLSPEQQRALRSERAKKGAATRKANAAAKKAQAQVDNLLGQFL